jgi:predicted phage terminase large subunit-like protein
MSLNLQELEPLDLETARAGLENLSDLELSALAWRAEWLQKARTKQKTPDGEWPIWMLMCGRGFGKTLVGAQDLGWFSWEHQGARCAVIAPTAADVRDTCFEGESGLVSIIPPELVKDYHRSLGELVLVNGSRIKGFSAEEPERLRGPQHHRVWCDELGAWGKEARQTWDMMKFGLRLGTNPRVIVTTTPKPTGLVKHILKMKGIKLTRGSTYENKTNLPDSFFAEVAAYEGTMLGRQELHAEIIDLEETGIIRRSWFQKWPSNKPLPKFLYIVQSYDTAYTEDTLNDPTACTVWGVFKLRELEGHPIYAMMLMEAWDKHIEYPDLRARMAKEWRENFYGDKNEARNQRRADMVLIEDKGSGIALRQDLARAGVPAWAYNPGKANKVQRAHVISPYIKNGLVFIPASSENFIEVDGVRVPDFPTWAQPFVSLVCSFPAEGNPDDYVDSLTQAVRVLVDQSWLTVDLKRIEIEIEEERKRVPAQTGNPYLQ